MNGMKGEKTIQLGWTMDSVAQEECLIWFVADRVVYEFYQVTRVFTISDKASYR